MNDLTRELAEVIAKLAAKKGKPAPRVVTTAEKILEREANPKFWKTAAELEAISVPYGTSDPDYTYKGK